MKNTIMIIMLAVMLAAAGCSRASVESSAPLPDSVSIGIEEARDIALRNAGVHESRAYMVNSVLWKGSGDGEYIYDIEFIYDDDKDGVEYDYMIDAVSGEILTFDWQVDQIEYEPLILSQLREMNGG